MLKRTELPCTLGSFTASFFELRCTLWATLHPLSYTAPSELWCTPLSCAYWAITHPYKLHCTLLSYDAAYWATLSRPIELCCTPLSCAWILLSYNTPYWATLHPVELWWSLLSYSLSPYWAILFPSELPAPSEQCCTLLSHGTLFRTELCCILLRYAAPTELHCTLLS